jgi:hypothetical protein
MSKVQFLIGTSIFLERSGKMSKISLLLKNGSNGKEVETSGKRLLIEKFFSSFVSSNKSESGKRLLDLVTFVSSNRRGLERADTT